MLTKNELKEEGPLLFRPPVAEDGPCMHALVERCKPLDVNSLYCYLILCEHFSSTCVVAEADGETVAMMTAYIPPDRPDTLFVWQIAVDASQRGRGVARKLFSHLLQRSHLADIRFIEATVNPSNDASRGLFHSLAATHNCDVTEAELFPASLFGEGGHEQENLLRVGPVSLKH